MPWSPKLKTISPTSYSSKRSLSHSSYDVLSSRPAKNLFLMNFYYTSFTSADERSLGSLSKICLIVAMLASSCMLVYDRGLLSILALFRETETYSLFGRRLLSLKLARLLRSRADATWSIVSFLRTLDTVCILKPSWRTSLFSSTSMLSMP